jgi:hypothetical protein
MCTGTTTITIPSLIRAVTYESTAC